MRNLTIQREKSFVACMATMKVYIEDPEAGDLTINGTRCRKLGVLKNGQTHTFQIPDDAANIYVIADKLSKGYCNECYPLPAGLEDIVLSGKCLYNPAAGNMFRFNGVTDANVLENRKKGSRIGVLVLAVAAIIGFVIGLWSAVPQKQTFSVNGMQITLTDEFEAEDYIGYDISYCTNEVMVLVLEESFSEFPVLKDYTLEEYGQVVIAGNNRKETLSKENGITYFEYQAAGSDGRDYHYVVTMFKGPDAFWLIQFVTPESEIATYRDDIFQWAASVTFEE